MILLDTNVVSETVRLRPDPKVRSWVDSQDRKTLYLASLTVAELRSGVIVMPEGKRKRELEDGFDEILRTFDGRILPFDTQAAHRYAELFFIARKAGRGFPTPDGYIAAIASLHGFAVATRDAAPFTAGGVEVINPWA